MSALNNSPYSQQKFSIQLLLFCLFILFFGYLSIRMGQDINWDLQNYHFYNAFAVLHHRLGWDIAPAMLQTYINPYLDVFNYLLITTQKPIVTAFILGAISGITAFFLYKTTLLLLTDASPKLRFWYAIFAVVIGTSGAAAISQLGTTTNETKVALLVMMALYFSLKAIAGISKRSRIININISGLFVGLAMGFKLTAATYVLGLAVALFLYEKPSLKNFSLYIYFGLSFILGFLLANGYWMWVLYQHFHNPLFPYYNNIFHSDYASFSNFEDTHFKPKNIMRYIFLPFYLWHKNAYAIEQYMRDFRLGAVYLFSVMAIILYLIKKFIFKKSTGTLSAPWKFTFIFYITAYLAWLIKFTIYRYAIPLELLSGPVIIYLCTIIFPGNKLSLSIIIILSWVLVKTTIYPDLGRIKFGEQYFVMNVPSIPAHSMILLIYQPLAFVIPAFPADTQFIGATNNIMSPELNNRLQQQANQIVLTHNGPTFTLSYLEDNNRAINYLSYFHWQQLTSQCQIINTNIHRILLLCPVSTNS